VIARVALGLAAIALSACSSRRTGDGVGDPAGPGSAGELRMIAETTCAGAGVTAIWLGVAVEPGLSRERGLRRLQLRRADGSTVRWRDVNDGADWPEIVFAPDCARVAVLLDRHGPYVVVPTAQLVRFAEGAPSDAHYLDDQPPCALAFTYSDLRWRSPTEVEYRAGGEPMTMRTADVTRAPTTRLAHPCRDPASPLYEAPSPVR
jgi:hypothetical protein